MMIRLCLIFSLLIAAIVAAWSPLVWVVICALPAGLILNILAWKSAAKSVRAMLPITIFIIVLASLQWLFQGFRPGTAAKTLAVFWLTASAFRLVPWSCLVHSIRPGSCISAFMLYMLFIRHFALVLASESRRVLTARSRAVLKPYGSWFFRSLTAALVSLFLRAVNRAERFYAAQILKGF
jgi:hypothetical protein